MLTGVNGCVLVSLGACGAPRCGATWHRAVAPCGAARRVAVRCLLVRGAQGACSTRHASQACPLRCGCSLGRGLGCGRSCGRGSDRGHGRRPRCGRSRAERRCAVSHHTSLSRRARPRRAPPHHGAAVPRGPHHVEPPRACPFHATQYFLRRGRMPRRVAGAAGARPRPVPCPRAHSRAQRSRARGCKHVDQSQSALPSS